MQWKIQVGQTLTYHKANYFILIEFDSLHEIDPEKNRDSNPRQRKWLKLNQISYSPEVQQASK